MDPINTNYHYSKKFTCFGQYGNYITSYAHTYGKTSFNYALVQRELVHITSYIQGIELVEAADSDPCTAVYHSHVCQELHLSLI
jgi:hypothetical protein